jgi:hypothetical protein
LSPDIVESRLRAHWDASAYTGRRRRGRDWYPAARRWAEDLARETGYTVQQVVAVLAITSPDIQLATNLDHAERILRGERDTGGRFPNVNRPKIAAVLADAEAAAEWARGPKVGPFHRAILGDEDALVLDRWAIFAATGERDERTTDRVAHSKLRDNVEAAYRALARKLRIPVRDLQATLWLQVRETTPSLRRGRQTTVRLADITA